jgi:hypothetical protein
VVDWSTVFPLHLCRPASIGTVGEPANYSAQPPYAQIDSSSYQPDHRQGDALYPSLLFPGKYSIYFLFVIG